MLSANLIVPITLIVLFLILHKILSRKQDKLQQHKNNFNDNSKASNQTFNADLHLQEHAFRHISSEIHDNISLTLTLSKIYLQDIDHNDSQQLNERIELSVALIKKAINDLNHLSKSLNPDLVERFGLIRSLRELVKDIESARVFSIELKIRGSTTFLSPDEELILFRIVQEALNNIIRHANAQHVIIGLAIDDSQLLLTIADNGCGFNVSGEKSCGSGITNMARRASLLNASFNINTIHPSGTVITISMPAKTNALFHAQRQHSY